MSSKEKIQKLLCDAICMLCQNTVEHHAQLSIEALIGITIDNGADILLVSIKELLTKSNQTLEAAYGSRDECDDESVSDTVQGYLYSEDESIPVDDDCEEIIQSDTLPSRAVVKPEVHLDHTVEGSECHGENRVVKGEKFIEHHDGYQASSSMDEREQHFYHPGVSIQKPLKRHSEVVHLNQTKLKRSFKDSGSFASSNPEMSHENLDLYVEEDSGGIIAQTGNTTSGWHSLPKSINRNAFRRKSKPSLNVARTGMMLDKSFDSGEQKAAEAGEVSPEVTHMTLYRCTLCGATMSRLDSFKRHKRTHLGTACASCDICGKTFSRVDNMNSHRRRCVVYGTQLKQTERYELG